MEPRHSAYPMAAAMGKLIWLVYVVKNLASLDPFLVAPAVSGAGERYRGSRVLSTVHCHAPVYRGFWKYVFPWWQLARFTLGIWCNISFSSVYLAVVVPRLGVACGVQNWIFREILGLLLCNTWFDSGYMFCDSLRRYWNELHIFFVAVDSKSEVFCLRSLAERRRVVSRCFSSQSCDAARTWNLDTTFMEFTWLPG